VTKFDFLRNFAFTSGQIVPHYNELMSRTVADLMTEAVVQVEPMTSLMGILQLMVSLKIRSFPVIELGGELVGIISRGDLMRALREATQEP
jgi:CBS domain-containing protein